MSEPLLEELVATGRKAVEISLSYTLLPAFKQEQFLRSFDDKSDFDKIVIGSVANIDEPYADKFRLSEGLGRVSHPWLMMDASETLVGNLASEAGLFAMRQEEFIRLIERVHDYPEEIIGLMKGKTDEEIIIERSRLVEQTSRALSYGIARAVHYTSETPSDVSFRELYGGIDASFETIYTIIDRLSLGRKSDSPLNRTRIAAINNLCSYDVNDRDSLRVAIVGARVKLADDLGNMSVFRNTPYHRETLDLQAMQHKIGSLAVMPEADQVKARESLSMRYGAKRRLNLSDNLYLKDGKELKIPVSDFVVQKRVLQPWKALTTLYEVLERIVEPTLSLIEPEMNYHRLAMTQVMTHLANNVANTAEQVLLQLALYQHGIKDGIKLYKESHVISQSFFDLPDSKKFNPSNHRLPLDARPMEKDQRDAYILLDDMWITLTQAERDTHSAAFEKLNTAPDDKLLQEKTPLREEDRAKRHESLRTENRLRVMSYLHQIKDRGADLGRQLGSYLAHLHAGGRADEFSFEYPRGQYEHMLAFSQGKLPE